MLRESLCRLGSERRQSVAPCPDPGSRSVESYVKLADQYDLEAFQPDVNGRAPMFVHAQTTAAGLEELASFDFWDEDVRRFYVATDAGLCVAVFTPRRDIRFEPRLETTVIPWQDVAGVQMEITSEIGEDTVLCLKIAEPVFERSSRRDRDLKALAEFGKVCLLRHGRR